jgi:hypothetical protein
VPTATYTTTAFTDFSQQGKVDGSAWSDESDTMLVDSAADDGWAGLLIDLAPSSQRIRPTVLTLTVTAGSGVVDVYFVPDTTPANYSTSLLPGTRSERLIASSQSASSGVITVDLTGGSNLADLPSFVAHSDWDGKIALSLQVTSDSLTFALEDYTGGAVDFPSLTAQVWSLDTGHRKDTGRRARARNCPRSGLPMLTDELQEDQFIRGFSVLADWWEPEDEQISMETNFPDTEGDVDEAAGV